MTDTRAFLVGVLAYLRGTEREPGVLWCAKHKIEHTGTTAYAALLESALVDPGAPAPCLTFASRIARRVVSRVREDPDETHGAWIVLPGSRDPHNHSNNAIDVGCAVDSLSTLARMHGNALEPELHAAIEGAVRRICDTYIARYSVTKEILAQRLWALAALGSAYAWLHEPRWKEAGLKCIDQTLVQQNSDGSFPYTPVGTPRSHPGSADVSAFYHSRHALFITHALESFGEGVNGRVAERPAAASEFLLALRRATGKKTTFVEAKPWYWGSDYEVAGASFDIASLLACGRALDEGRYRAAAAEMFETLVDHVEPDGGITSHHGAGWDFQCRSFWNAHCAWIARNASALDTALSMSGRAASSLPARELRWFPDAGFGRYADERIVVLFRGAKPLANLNHGSPLGGGGLLHAASRAEPNRELVGKDPRAAHVAGEWTIRPRGAPSRMARVKQALDHNREALRFTLWIGRVRLRAGEPLGALGWVMTRGYRGIVEASRRQYSSAFATDVQADRSPSRITFRGGCADVFGTMLKDVRTIRTYTFGIGQVHANDTLAADRELTQCSYAVPKGADELVVDGPHYSMHRGILQFGTVRSGALIAIRYRIQAP